MVFKNLQLKIKTNKLVMFNAPEFIPDTVKEPVLYRDARILVGNWPEKRLTYKKDVSEPNYQTTYTAAFVPFPAKMNVLGDLWERKLVNEGVSRDNMFDLHPTAYKSNYATLYDLSFNPDYWKLTKPKVKHYDSSKDMYLPEPDLTLQYGNLSERGIIPYKKPIWEWERKLEKSTRLPLTTTQQDYTPPKLEEYTKKRFVSPKTGEKEVINIQFPPPKSFKIMRRNIGECPGEKRTCKK